MEQRHLTCYILDALNDYDKQKTPEIPKTLEEYINHLAKTGETLFPWPKIRGVLRHKLELVISNFKEVCPTENLPPCPNVEPFKFEIVRDKILQQFDSFTCAPFTIQRLCELLCAPRKHYKRTDKFMRGIEKNLLVVTTVDPEQRKRSESVSSSQTLVNGVVDISVGSSRPLATFGTKNESRPVALDAASVSDADSGISDTEDEDKPSAKHSSSTNVPDTGHQEPSEAKETANGAADADEEIEPSSKTETVSSGPAEALGASVTATKEQSPTVQISEDVIVPVVAPTDGDEVEKALAAPTEEECAKGIDVESVASEEKPVEMQEEKLVTNVEPGTKEEADRIAVEPLQEPQESRMTIDAEVKHPLPPSESTETPISDKKRPLEKTASEEDDDSEHSPDAKQPRIFSPDKVMEGTPLPEHNIVPDNHVDEEQIAVTKPEETADKAPEADPTLPTMESQ
uniref:EOG090X0BWU n=1 Tax=Daphnia lumholtzi TaxID=42856 RepID=A0A4Y7MEJ3_9CRUS|nr:EOG090X0BWU [Daphnia lumholtzi]